MGPDLYLLEDDDEPTERFARQQCPRCGTDTAVALRFATAPCERCGVEMEVAPVMRAAQAHRL